MDIKTYLATRKSLIDDTLDSYLSADLGLPALLLESMRYSVFAGGKRVRPILTLAAGEAVGGPPELILPAACAIELVHTCSLIHDDLPALDNSDYRRGQAANHKVYGQDIALVAGDELLAYAFEILGSAYSPDALDPALNLRLVREIAAGIRGTVAGQVIDLQSGGKQPKAETLKYIHQHKTGDLITVSARAGALIAGADETQLDGLTRYARSLGLAFQIIDDILGAVGDDRKLGKRVGQDASQQKMTYVALYGLEQARAIVREEINTAKAALAVFGDSQQVAPLYALADFVMKREH
jgi:geranylgeranyl diphosphate synthase type II